MKKKHFGDEYLFEFIWNNCDHQGIWNGDAATVAAEFAVTENDADDTLSKLCNRNRIQRVGKEKYIISRWRYREESQEDLLC